MTCLTIHKDHAYIRKFKVTQELEKVSIEFPSLEATCDRQIYSQKMAPLHLVQGHGFTALDLSIRGFATLFQEQSHPLRSPLDTPG